MALSVGVDAYVSLADANAYFVKRGNASWAASTDAVKEAAIVRATAYMDAAYSWKGTIMDTAQALGWPRLNVWDLEGRSQSEIIPTKVKEACCELALLAMGGDLLGQGANVSSERVGQVAITYEAGQGIGSIGYAYVSLLLRGLGSLRGGNQTVKLERV